MIHFVELFRGAFTIVYGEEPPRSSITLGAQNSVGYGYWYSENGDGDLTNLTVLCTLYGDGGKRIDHD